MKTSLTPFGTRLGVFDDFRKEFDNLLGRFWTAENGGDETAQWAPRLNLAETEQAYELTLDLPGVKPEDMDVELKHGELWITGKREHEAEESGKQWHRVERFQGQFRRVIRLGDDVNPEQVDAEYKDGVLHVRVPKSDTAQTRHIQVRS